MQKPQAGKGGKRTAKAPRTGFLSRMRESRQHPKVDIKVVDRKLWLTSFGALLVIILGVGAIIIAKPGQQKTIALGQIVAISGALLWAAIKIIAYFRVAVAFMLRETEKAARARDSDRPPS